ncbi:MAG: T9SS type A sorting domain-containing protein [Saprospiraceae bacterium]|nr:T9SS type A sorting domain-containing protein [Saprospiraceae bacterium]
MKKQLLLLMFVMMGWTSAYAQIPDGSTAPDFTATDLNGGSHHLYSLLDSGYTVFLDVSATWCGPCWNYHNSGALEQLYDDYGPNGTNEVRVFFAEGDASTNLACLYGPAGCVGGTQGNWVAGTPYPILHAQGPSIGNSYQISYYPTIFAICPWDKKVYEAGQLPTSGLYDFHLSHCGPPVLLIESTSVTKIKCHGTNTGAIDITPSGGVPPYTYNWSNGATTQDISNVAAGTYTVTVSGRIGTVGISDPIEVEGPAAPLSLTLESTTPVGCNGILGTATVAAAGGWSDNYTYNWQNGQFGETAINLNAGNHIVSVTDDNNCKVSITVNMAPAVYPTASVATPGTITCSQPAIQLNGTGSSSGPDISYQWFAGGGGNIVSGATSTTPIVDAAGTYTLQVTNIITTCAAFASKAVSADLDPPTANAGPSQNISCTVPEATLQGTGSSGSNFSYLWTAANGGNIVSGSTTLNPVVNGVGDYTLKITNSTNGCTQTSTTNVTGTPKPSLTTTSGTLNCVVSAINLTTTTNAASPTFAWTGPNGYSSSLQSPTVNVSGTYNVVVTDSITTCTSTATANVTSNTNAPGASAMGNTLTCVVNSVVIMGSTPDTTASFAWTGPNNFSSSLQNPTVGEAGNYNLVVTDTINGCTSTASAAVVLNITPPVASAIAAGNLNCNTSQIQLNGTGSSQGANITYAWTANNGGHIVSGANTQTPLVDSIGTYSILVSNVDNGCTQTASANVMQSPTVSSAIAAQSNVRCNGAANGQATAAGGGGNGNYTYVWSNGSSTATISGLGAGNYIVVVTDGENCSATTSVAITQPNILSANANATAQSAFGQNDGTATVNPSGGTAGYTYVWDNGGIAQTITDLAPGNYSVVVTDANGCTAVQTVTVNAFNCILSANISGVNVVCNGASNGSAEVLVTAGADPTTFIWSNGATTASVGNLTAGLYTVNVTDGNNCPASLSISITEPALLDANISSTAESALGANDGTASANPTGGTGAYAYAWSNGGFTQTITGLSPGTYTVVVTDEKGCTSEQTVEVSSFLCAISSQNTILNVTCAGAANGSVTVSLTGGTAPFSYAWSNGGTSATIANLSGGIYTVNVSDANGCDFSTEASVAEPAPYSPWDIQTVNPLCPNDATGSATASITGGTEPYSFLWSNGATGNSLANVPSGNYNVEVTDANGCKSSTSVSLTSSDNEAPTITAQNATLALSNNGTVQVTLAALNTQFSDNCGISSTSISPQNFNCQQLGGQTVTLIVTDLSGNTSTATALVTVIDNIVPVLTCPANMVVCSYNNVVNYGSPVAEDNCLLAGNGHWDIDGPSSGSMFPEGVTKVTYTYTDASGNAGTCSFDVTVTSAVLFTDINVNNDVNGQQVGSIDITVDGGAGPYLFEWIDENGNIVGNTEDVEGLGEGSYRVQITDANGCVYTETDIKLQNTSSVKEPTWLTGVSLQPNPTNGITNVIFSLPVASTLEITVIDATGRILFTDISEQESMVRIDCTNLPGGVYTLRFRTGYEVGVRKLVVNK